jgi:hypothetical protein
MFFNYFDVNSSLIYPDFSPLTLKGIAFALRDGKLFLCGTLRKLYISV